jgi:uncharacterized glyoxalase superfamily protein PhnB
MAVKPIPEGYHTITLALAVPDAAKAIEFYKEAFGAVEHYRMPGPNGKVMHAELGLGDSTVMVGPECEKADGPRSPKTLGGIMRLAFLYVENVDAAFEKAVKAGAKVKMPVSDMFWGDRYGQVVDPFGYVWELATHKEDLTPEQIRERVEKTTPQMAHA